MISDVNGTPVGTIVQSTSLKEMVFKPSRSLEVALTDAEGNPQQTVMTISDPPNFLRDTYEVHLPGIEQPMAVITKRFSMFKTKMELTMGGLCRRRSARRFLGLEPHHHLPGSPACRCLQ